MYFKQLNNFECISVEGMILVRMTAELSQDIGGLQAVTHWG